MLIGTAVGRPHDGRKSGVGGDELIGYPERLRDISEVSGEGIDFGAVWLRALQITGAKITDDDLIGNWLRHINYASDEYAYARANFRKGVSPPLSGVLDNPFRESLGALARAGLWGMLAPADPEQAAWLTRRDAMLDHSGAGIEIAIWLAGLVSGAFVEGDVARLIEAGLALIPEAGRVGHVVRDVVRWQAEYAHWGRTREMLLRSHGTDDIRDGAIAAGFIALALLHGRGDFAKSVLTAAGCGWSSAATCAAVGTVVGILPGEGGLPSDWRTCFRGEGVLSGNVVGLPRSLPSVWMAEQISEMGRIVVRSESGGRVQFATEAPEEDPKLAASDAANLLRQLAVGPYVATYRRGPLRIQIDYDSRPTIGYDVPRRLTVALSNTTNRTLEVQSRLAAPAGFVVAAASETITLTEGTMVSFVLTMTAPRGIARIAPGNPCTLFVTVDDGSEFTVPVTLAGEAIWYASGPYGSFDEGHPPEDPAILSGERGLGVEGSAPSGAERWRRLSVAEPMVNIIAGLEGERGTYYLATDLMIATPLRVRLRVACNDGIKVWLNGSEVHYQHEHRSDSPSSAYELDVEFRGGWNRLVIKLAQCTPRRYLAVASKNLQGQILLEAVNTEGRRA